MPVNGLLMAVWEKAVGAGRERRAELATLIAERGPQPRGHALGTGDTSGNNSGPGNSAFGKRMKALCWQLEKIIDACSPSPSPLRHHRNREEWRSRPITRTSASSRYATPQADLRPFSSAIISRAPRNGSGAWMTSFQSQHRLKLGNGTIAKSDRVQCLQLRQAAEGQARASLDRDAAHALP